MKSGQALFSQFLKTLFQHTASQLPTAFALMFMASVTEGIGLMLLIPMLTILGLNTGTDVNPFVQSIQSAFSTFGVSFSLIPVLTVFLALIVFRALLLYLRDNYLLRMQLEFVDDLRGEIHQAIGRARWSFLVKLRTSDMIHTLTEDIDRIGFAVHILIQSVVMIGMGLAYIAISFYLSPELSIIAMLAGSALLIALRGYSRKALQLGKDETETGKTVFASINEFLNGIKLVKSYCAEAFYYQYYRDATSAQREKQLDFARITNAARQAFQIGSALLLSLFIYIAIELLDLPVSYLLIMSVIFVRLMPLLSGLQRNYEQILHMLPAYASAMNLLADCIKASEPLQIVENHPFRMTQAIQLKDVEFGYKSSQQILNQVSITIPFRKTVAIIGESGAGKSTLADLLAGLVLPDKGTINIDSLPLNINNLSSWRSRVAYVPQDVHLFNDSLRANLQWASPESDDSALWLALDLAAAKGFVSALPNQLDTIVGERGIRLSGGERQRIALARALLRKPDLLILDEATSALDSNNERLIQQSIESLHGNLTIVVIAHRFTTIEHADQFLLVKNGQVTQTSWHQINAK